MTLNAFRFYSPSYRKSVIGFFAIFCLLATYTEAKKWDLFASPSKNRLECFYENGLSKNNIEVLKKGRPEDKKLRKKAKKALQACVDVALQAEKKDKKNQGNNASRTGSDLQVLKLERAFVEGGTTILAVPNKTKTGRIVEISKIGEVVWEYLGNKKFGRIDDAKLTLQNTVLIAAEKGAYEIDRSGRIIWSFIGKVSHDIDRLENGNTILNYAWGPKGDDKIIEVDSNGQIVWKWDGLASHDKAPFNETYAHDAHIHGSEKTWIHNNSVTVLPNDVILVSLRDFQEIIWINRSGQVIKRYRFKCKSSKRAMQTSGKIQGCNPHEPQVLKNGNIVVGLRNPDRAIEFNPKTSKITWEWRSFNSKLYGTIRDVDKLKNGNYQIVTGGHLLEIDPNGNVVMDIGANPALSNDHRILYKAQKIYADGTIGHD